MKLSQKNYLNKIGTLLGGKDMCRRYYTVEMVKGSGRMPEQFETYEKAYAALCNEYVREINEGYTPTLYQILRHDENDYGGHFNSMIQPCWS